MIDLDELEAKCSMAIANGYGHLPVIDCGNAVKVMELITSLRRAEKDAARYRCIKSIAKVIECEEFEMDTLDGQDLDVMVDECIEAMKCER